MSYSRVKHSRKLCHAGCGRNATWKFSMGEPQRGYKKPQKLTESKKTFRLISSFIYFIIYSHCSQTT